MQRTHFLTAFIAAASTIGITAALGFAQPDGIDPPAGPVMDTQPSLTSIDQKLEGILDNPLTGPFQTIQHSAVPSGQSVSIDEGPIRIVRVIVQKGTIDFTADNGDHSLDLRAATEIDPNGVRRRLDAFSYELNIDVLSSITITSTDSTENADFIVVYKELP